MSRIVAHRGVHNEHGGPRENTLAAIRAAIADGATWIEIDVRLTADGAVVLLHDSTLHRLWGDHRRIDQVPLAEVELFGGGDHRIPLLADAIALARDAGATLLIDMDEPAPAAAAAEVVRELDAIDATAWCGDGAAMRIVRTELPAAQVWQPWYSVVAPTVADIAELSPTVINARHLLVGTDFVHQVHQLGLDVAVWTVDDESQAAHLASIGVDSITTNRLTAIARAAADGPAAVGHVDPRARQYAIATELARDAAEFAARARQRGIGDVDTKRNPADHATEVDREIERRVSASIRAQFPDHDFVGEEFGGQSTGRPCWYLDPVDGTANLVNGVPWTSFSLALLEQGRPVVGVIVDPVGGDVATIGAIDGRGAWRRTDPIRISGSPAPDPLEGKIVVTELSGAAPWPGFVPMLTALSARHCTLRIPGSGTATLAGVALGRGIAALVHRYSPIDHAASILIVAEAGGVVLDRTGVQTTVPAPGPVFTGADHAAVTALFEVWRTATAG